MQLPQQRGFRPAHVRAGLLTLPLPLTLTLAPTLTLTPALTLTVTVTLTLTLALARYELVANRWMSQPFTPLGRACMVLAIVWGHSVGT